MTGDHVGSGTEAPEDELGAAGRAAALMADGGALASGVVLASKYRLVKELGCGGMGAVWQAHNLVLDVDVAIKVLRADLQKPNLSDRLLREARAVARLGHPNIVRVYDVGHTAQGTPFLVMELLRGVNLAQTIRGPGRLEAVTAVKMLLPIAHALARAHEAGFLHRDLKPENIFLAKQPGSPLRPVLLDFSIALSWNDLSNRLTQEGTLVGTPAFMSPEQAQGDEVTAQGDLWAFTVLLYETVTGQLPFSNPIFPRLQREIIERPAPSFAHHGIKEDALWTIVEKGLRKKPQQRWPGMRAMGEALAGWLLGQGVDADVTNASIRSTWLKPPESDEEGEAASEGDGGRWSEPLFTMTATIERSWLASHWAWLLAAALLLLVGAGAALLAQPGQARPGEKPAPVAKPAGSPAAPVARPAGSPAAVAPQPPASAPALAPTAPRPLPVAAKVQPTTAGSLRPALPRSPRGKTAAKATAPSPPARTASPRPTAAPARPKLDIKTDF